MKKHLVILKELKKNGQTGTEAFIDNIKYGLDFLKPKAQPAEAPAQQK
ncbi:MAG: hypothetical protein L6U16_02095 [Porphyromonadaceae bacterium]|nr:MAG: hypothetical protein L6U16_02095 [Porphyromonadaceae bacterium]